MKKTNITKSNMKFSCNVESSKGSRHTTAVNFTYGYIRVSTKEQNEERQVLAMREFGIENELMIIDKQSGKDFDRPGYKRLIRRLQPGDTVVVKSIDRLGRDYDEILEQWRFLTKDMRAYIVVLDMPLLDTRNGRDLTGTLISDIVLQLLSYVAQTEREFIRQRQREGIEIARANGVHIGRFPMARPDNYNDVKARWQNGEISGRTAATMLGISHTTFRFWMRDEKAKEAASQNTCNH